jgi:nucleotide-binding universal stress UspA family protein
MTAILIPCDGSANALMAVRRAFAAYRRGEASMLHLLNVQPEFSPHVMRYTSQRARRGLQRERADQALAQARALLDAQHVPYDVHMAVGDRADCILQAARRLHCDRIVIGTARASALVRAVSNSLTTQLIERSPVPVEVVAGAPAAAVVRLGVPAGIGAGMAWLWIG